MSHAKINNIVVKDQNNIVLQDIKGSDIFINLNNQDDNSLENTSSQNKYTEAIHPILKVVQEAREKNIDINFLPDNSKDFHAPAGQDNDFLISSKSAINDVCSKFYDSYHYEYPYWGEDISDSFLKQRPIFIHNKKKYQYTKTPDGKKAYVYLPNSEKVLTNDVLVVPWPDINSADFIDILYKTIHYYDFIVFTVPCVVDSYFRSYSALGTIYYYDTTKKIIELNCNIYNFLSQCIFLPYKVSNATEFASLIIEERAYEIDLHQDYVNNYFPLNNGQTNIEDTIIYERIVIPYFKGISFHDLIKIKQNETESFKIFQHFLRRKLNELKSANTPDRIRYLSEEIDYEVQKLTLECKKLSKSLRVMSGAHLSFFCTSLLAAATQNFSTIAQTAAITGGAYSLYQSIKEYVSYREKIVDLKKSDFYIPYLFN